MYNIAKIKHVMQRLPTTTSHLLIAIVKLAMMYYLFLLVNLHINVLQFVMQPQLHLMIL